MADRRAARQAAEALGAEHVGHPPHGLLDVQRRAVGGRDPGGLLAPVLERVETQVGEVGGLRVVEDAEEAALVVELVVVEPDGFHAAPSASRPDSASTGCPSARDSPFSNASASASVDSDTRGRDSDPHLEPVPAHAAEDLNRHGPLPHDPRQALHVSRRHRDEDAGRRLAEEQLVHAAPVGKDRRRPERPADR